IIHWAGEPRANHLLFATADDARMEWRCWKYDLVSDRVEIVYSSSEVPPGLHRFRRKNLLLPRVTLQPPYAMTDGEFWSAWPLARVKPGEPAKLFPHPEKNPLLLARLHRFQHEYAWRDLQWGGRDDSLLLSNRHGVWLLPLKSPK
ncbi:MAG: hypothetical protein N2C14_07080, partial [Planctomycetales bacterium]